MMNILECQELFQHPLLYGTFLLWMLSEIYEMFPEAGDLDKPKLAFFFDEAHLLFKDAPNDQKDVRAATSSFRENPAFDTKDAKQKAKEEKAAGSSDPAVFSV